MPASVARDERPAKGSRARWLWRSGVLLAVTAVMAAGCGSDDQGGSSGGGERDLTLGLTQSAAVFAPFYIAQDQGYFKDEGLNVKFVALQGGDLLLKGMSAGSIDIGASALSDPLVAIEKGQPLKVFFGGIDNAYFAWYAKDPSIRTLADAKGKTIGVSRPGSALDFNTRYALRQQGLDPDKDVKIRGVGGLPAIIAGVKAGPLDIAAISKDFAPTAEKAGLRKVGDQRGYVSEYPLVISLATTQFLQKNQDTVTRYLRALVRAIKFTKSNRQAVKDTLVKHKLADPAALDVGYRTATTSLYADGRLPDEKSMNAFWDMGKQVGLWDGPIPESKWLDRKWLDDYAKSGEGSTTARDGG